MWFSVFMLALRSVQRNMLRSFLTILGIVIGVAAVVTMVTLGNGATQAIDTQITSLGSNLLLVMPGQRSHEIMALLLALNRDHGITVLMVTHEPDMAAYARRMVHFVDGRIARDVANENPTTTAPQQTAAEST